MNNLLTLTDYGKKIEGYMQEFSQLSHCTGKVQVELISSLEVLQSSTGGKILMLFIEISMQFFSRLLSILLSKENTSESDRINKDRMSRIDHYIQTNLDKDMNIKIAADYIGMSTGYFSRFFSKMFQCSFIEYLTHCRVNFAAKLLKDTNMQIIDICYRSGFNSPNQFNRVFKKKMNMTPGEYRYQ